MKKLLIILLCFAGISITSRAQNLVPNPGFEEFADCPDGAAQIYRPQLPGSIVTVEDWVNPTITTPDYFNACSDNTIVDVPENFLGNHPAHGGDAYAGFLAFYKAGVDYHHYEYLQTKIKAPLTAGEAYDVSCYVKLIVDRKFGHGSGNGKYAVEEIHASLADTQQLSEERRLDGNAISMKKRDGGFITDSTSWVKITGIYHAKGGEQWLTIGIFNTTKPETVLVHPDEERGVNQRSSYYIIDDVNLDIHIPCDTLISCYDTIICNPQMVPFSVSSKGKPVSYYKWSTGDTTSAIKIKEPGTYWCYAYNDCHLIIDTFRVKTYKDTVLTTTDSMLCKVAGYKISLPPGSPWYKWNTGETTRQLVINAEGSYTGTYTSGCLYHSHTYNIIPHTASSFANDCKTCLYAPSAFSPNRDGLNDYFRVMTSCTITQFTMRIYNRWGQEVFTTQNVNSGWDGMQAADMADIGTYFYFIEYTTPFSAKSGIIKGDFILVR